MNWRGLHSDIKTGFNGQFNRTVTELGTVEQSGSTWSCNAFSIEIKRSANFIQTNTG
ncbi:MAG: hypothetical protein RPR97_01935 [Colwellia sp.]|jgi:hypothetical protein